MRPQKVDEHTLINGLMQTFRTKGYEGASLMDLSSATGLKKASLYHRFPGGKVDMARTVLAFVEQWIHQRLFLVLTDQKRSKEDRIFAVLRNLNQLYDRGEASCVLRALSMQSGLLQFQEELQQCFQLWIQAFTTFGLDLGFSAKAAEQKAIQTLVQIQGSLIVASGLSNTSVFQTALKSIKSLYDSPNKKQ